MTTYEELLAARANYRTFRNTNYTTRNYECTNVVACRGPEAPNENYVECDPSEIAHLESLYVQDETRYYGYL